MIVHVFLCEKKKTKSKSTSYKTYRIPFQDMLFIHLCIVIINHGIICIRITCPCNEHPLTPHFYIEKVGFTRVYIFFLFLLQNINCGYSLEPPR